MSLRNIRDGPGSAPLEKEVSRLAKEMAINKTKDQVGKVDEPEDIFPSGTDDETAVHFHDELGGTQQLFDDIEYGPTFEPDYNKVTLMLEGKNLGNQLKDYSGFGNHAKIYGEPLLIDGAPFDPGLFTGGNKSIAMRFNRPTSKYVNQEYMTIPDAASLQVLGITTGISYMIRFRLNSLAQQSGLSPTLLEKIDDNTPNNGIIIKVIGGRLVFDIKRAGTDYKKESSTTLIAADKVYTLFLTYAVSGNAQTAYICEEPNTTGTTITLNSSSDTPNWHTTLTNHEFNIFRRGQGTAGGYCYADFYNCYVYREKVISSAEAGYMFSNKTTIYNQAHPMVVNHFESSN